MQAPSPVIGVRGVTLGKKILKTQTQICAIWCIFWSEIRIYVCPDKIRFNIQVQVCAMCGSKATLVLRSRMMTTVSTTVTVTQSVWTPSGTPRSRASYSAIQDDSTVHSASEQTRPPQLGQLTAAPTPPDSSRSTYTFNQSANHQPINAFDRWFILELHR